MNISGALSTSLSVIPVSDVMLYGIAFVHFTKVVKLSICVPLLNLTADISIISETKWFNPVVSMSIATNLVANEGFSFLGLLCFLVLVTLNSCCLLVSNHRV